MSGAATSTPAASPDRRRWLEEFRSQHGRAPRVLHIGNIANNAYKNVKHLNAWGVDCDVICYDYYHIMACPEWEDADFPAAPKDQFRPDWASAKLGNFERPRWFAQGPLEVCIDYLVARRQGHTDLATALWMELSEHNRTTHRSLAALWTRLTGPDRAAGKLLLIRQFSAGVLRLLGIPQLKPQLRTIAMTDDLWGTLWGKIRRNVPARGWFGDAITFVASVLSAPAVLVVRAILMLKPARDFVFSQSRTRDRSGDPLRTWTERVELLVALFQEVFPGRRDRLTTSDFYGYQYAVGRWRDLFEHYDIVQAYSTDPILPMIAGKRPYIAFEHGTLRGFTLADNPVSRLNSLAYNQADHVFITNGDCLDYARKIGVTRYTAMLHPIDEHAIRSLPPISPDLRTELGVRHVFLCTLRHDWSVKGTDKYIRALPGIEAAIGGDFMLLMTKWGAELDASMRLADELGVSGKIKWIDPLTRPALARTQKSVDVLFDQIALPHFGGTAPEGIAAGIPVIMSYDRKSTDWIVAEPAPVLIAWTVEEIVRNVCIAIDLEWRAGYQKRAADWIDRFHSSSIVIERHLEAYGRLLAPRIAHTH